MPEAKRVAAIDCGTNSIRLLISDVTPGAGVLAMRDLQRRMEITRLGQGVDQTGELLPSAIDRTLEVARAYQKEIERSGATEVRVAATSATRDASNRQVFVEGIRLITGIQPEVITGKEEAGLSFRGAMSSLPADLEAPYLVVDIGGGSTEFVLGIEGVENSVSVDMGSVRVTERFGPEPWTERKLLDARQWIDERIVEAAEIVDLRSAQTIVGVAGTVTTLAALIARVPKYDPAVTHGLRPTGREWLSAMGFLVEAPVAEKQDLPFMPPGRADVIGGGVLIWERVLRYLGVLSNLDDGSATPAPDQGVPAVVVSEHDILDGLALSLVGE